MYLSTSILSIIFLIGYNWSVCLFLFCNSITVTLLFQYDDKFYTFEVNKVVKVDKITNFCEYREY